MKVSQSLDWSYQVGDTIRYIHGVVRKFSCIGTPRENIPRFHTCPPVVPQDPCGKDVVAKRHTREVQENQNGKPSRAGGAGGQYVRLLGSTLQGY